MYKQRLLLAAVAVCLSMSTGSSTDAATIPGPKIIVRRMVKSLVRQARIEVRGSSVGPGSARTRYVVRYEAGGRESIVETGGSLGAVAVGKKHAQGIWIISIDNAVYRSIDHAHWFRSTRTSVPAAVDVLGINPLSLPCCLNAGKTATLQLRVAGLRQFNGHEVYVLAYTRAGSGQYLRGRVLIDSATYLPLRYVQTSQAPLVRGTFSFSFRSRFHIVAPI